MRKLLIGLLLCAPFPGSAMSDVTAQDLAAKAEQAYAAGDVVTALALYDSVAVEHVSPALLYNIGNCHFRAGDLARAVLFYERSLLRDPSAEDVRANLELARSLLRDRINEVPRIGLAPLWDRMSGGLSVDQWAVLAWLALVLSCIAFAISLWGLRRPGLSSALRIGGSTLGLLALVALLLASYRHSAITDSGMAIIMQQKMDVHSEPRESSTVQVQLHEGTRVEVLQERNDWSEVKLENGTVGWMPTAALEMI